MRPVLRRIAIHGSLTAVVLGIVGLMFAELASIWMAGSPGTRTANGQPVEADADGAVAEKLRERVPLFMAVWGFGFVAVGEVVMHFLRSRRPTPPPATQQPDDAEKLLLELLAQAESRQGPAVANPASEQPPVPGP